MNCLASCLLIFTAAAAVSCGGNAGAESGSGAAPDLTGTPNDSQVPNHTDRTVRPTTPNASDVPNGTDAPGPRPSPEPPPGPSGGDACRQICSTAGTLGCSLVGTSGDCVGDCRNAEGMECGPELFAVIRCALDNGSCPADVDTLPGCSAVLTRFGMCFEE